MEHWKQSVHAELNADLQATLRRSDVDVVVLNNAPPLLYYRVLRDGVRLVMRDAHQTAERVTRALSRYFDFIPQLAKIEAAHKFARERAEADRARRGGRES